MNIRSLIAPALLLAACSEGPVRRNVTFAAEDNVPQAFCTVVGDKVHLVISGLEPLDPAHRLFAWALVGSAWQPAGAVEVGNNSLEGASWADVAELLVTVEEATPPGTPSSAVIFRGPLAGPLAFGGEGGPTFKSLSAAHVTALLEDKTFTAHATNLPSLGDGMYYGVWLMAGEEMTLLGKLQDGETVLTGDELLASHDEVAITLELEHGLADMGPEVMHAEVYTPGAGAAPASGEGHMHMH